MKSHNYGNFKSRSKASSIVFAMYNGELQPVATLDRRLDKKIVSCLSWYKHHEEKDSIGQPVAVWEHDLFDVHNFISATEEIHCRSVSLIDKLNESMVKFYSCLLITTNYNEL